MACSNPTIVHFTKRAFDSKFSQCIQRHNSPNFMSRFIRAILFDLGGTLMYSRGPWPPIEARADLMFAENLRSSGLDIDPSEFALLFRKRLKEYYVRREEDLFETTYRSVALELLQEEGYANITEPVLQSALDALYSVTQANWELESDAIPMLKNLESSGYRLGLVSNAGDNKDVFQLAERFRIEPYFDFILTSAACSYRKPHPRIFELALAHWNIPASESAMVGDTLDADILGAQRAGLFTIWITRRATPKAEDLLRIKPDLSLPSLQDIPAAVNGLH